MIPKYNNIKSISIGLGILTILIILKFTFSWTDEFLTAIISGVAFIGFIISLQLQRNSIDIQHQELKNSIEEIRNQTEEFKKQNDEYVYRRILDITYKQIELTNDELYRLYNVTSNFRIYDIIKECENSFHNNIKMNEVAPDSNDYKNRLNLFIGINNQLNNTLTLFSTIDNSIILIKDELKKTNIKVDFIKIYFSNLNMTILLFIFNINEKVIDTNEKIIKDHKLYNIIHILDKCKETFNYIKIYNFILPPLQRTKLLKLIETPNDTKI